MERGAAQAIGPYRVAEQLGRGSMGVVYLVQHEAGGPPRALKVMAAELLEDHRARERFRLELESLVKIRGSVGVVDMVDAGVAPDGLPYIVMEFVDGPSLKTAMRTGIPADLLLEGLEQVARGLHNAHSQGFIHRDVKPENILIGRDGAKITDFGLVHGLLESRGLTQAGDILGTVAYMAPEQVSPDRGDPGPWTDVYSMGAVLYEVLTGRPPIQADGAVQLITKLLLEDTNAEITPPSKLNPEVSRSLDFVCLRSLRRAPAERYQSMEQFAEDLAKARPAVTSSRDWIQGSNARALASRALRAASSAELVRVASSSGSRVVPAAHVDAEPNAAQSSDDPLEVSLASGELPGLSAPPGPPVEDPELLSSGPRREEAAGVGRSQTLGILGAVAALSVLTSLAAGIMVVVRPGDPSDPRLVASRLVEVERLIEERDWDGALQRAADTKPEPGSALANELRELVTAAYAGRTREVFLNDDTRRAHQLLPTAEGSPAAAFPDAAWVQALVGQPSEALRTLDALPEEQAPPPAVRARIAAWAGDEAACRESLGRMTALEARCLAWNLSRWLPAVRPAPGDLFAPVTAELELLTRGEEALARGLIPLAAACFDDAFQTRAGIAPPLEIRFQGALGSSRVAVARGDAEGASRWATEALRLARHPLERARGLRAAARAIRILGPEAQTPEALLGQVGGAVPAKATLYAPGVPGMAPLLLVGPLPPLGERSPWGAGGQVLANARQRAAAGAPLPEFLTEGSFCQGELLACRQGRDGAPGLLLARAAELAQAADDGCSLPAAREALRLAQAATRLAPESPAAWQAVARCQLVQKRFDEAQAALARARALAPEDPALVSFAARLSQARAERDLQAVDEARARGAPLSKLEDELSARLAEVSAAWQTAREAAPARTALARRATLSWCHLQLERARLDPQDRGQRHADVREALAPLLSGVDLTALAQARAGLLEALVAGKTNDVTAAELALADASGGADLEALWLRTAADAGDEQGSRDARAAFLALAGDLPARALLRLRESGTQETDAAAGEVLARARSLGPNLPGILLTRELRRGTGRDAVGFRRLADVFRRAPEWLYLALGSPYLVEGRLGPDDSQRALNPAAARDPTLERLARAVLLRSVNVFQNAAELSAAELRQRSQLHDRISREGLLETSLVLQGEPQLVAARLVRAMFISSLAGGSIHQASPDRRVWPDVTHDLACARAAFPEASAGLLLLLRWDASQTAGAVGELLAQGFVNNPGALLNQPNSEPARRLMIPVLDRLRGEQQRVDVFTRVRAQALQTAVSGDPSLAELSLALALDLAERPGPVRSDDLPRLQRAAESATSVSSPRADEAHPVSQLFGPRGALLAYAEARLNLNLGRSNEIEDSRRGSVLKSAAAAAVRAHYAARPPGAPFLLDAHATRAIEVRPRLPQPFDRLLATAVPGDAGLWALWRRAQRPGPPLVLARAALSGEQAEALGRELLERAALACLQDGVIQEEEARRALRAGDLDEAILASMRAAAFSRREPPGLVLRRLLRDSWRPAWRQSDDPRQARELARDAWALARQATAGSPSPLYRGLLADVLLDLAGLYDDPKLIERARGSLAEVTPENLPAPIESPVIVLWRQARAAAAAGDETAARDWVTKLRQALSQAGLGGEELLADERQGDPLAERLAKSKALAGLGQ